MSENDQNFQSDHLISDVSLPEFIRELRPKDQPTFNPINRPTECTITGMSSKDILLQSSRELSQKGQNQSLIDSSHSREGKGRLYAKNYRQKMKIKSNQLEEENRFLKNKVNDLTFRLHEVELELNKIKHKELEKNTHYHKIKEECVKKINEVCSEKHKVNEEQLKFLQEKFTEINSFGNDSHLQLLNYHMGEVLENIIPDSLFYLIDGLVKKRGIWGEEGKYNYTKIDQQLNEILGLNFQQAKQTFSKLIPEFARRQYLRIYQLWRQFYETYLKIINKCTFLGSTLRNNEPKRLEIIRAQKMMKIQMYFQKIKYSKEFRKIKQSWYQNLSVDQTTSHSRQFIGQFLKQPAKKRHQE